MYEKLPTYVMRFDEQQEEKWAKAEASCGIEPPSLKRRNRNKKRVEPGETPTHRRGDLRRKA